ALVEFGLHDRDHGPFRRAQHLGTGAGRQAGQKHRHGGYLHGLSPGQPAARSGGGIKGLKGSTGAQGGQASPSTTTLESDSNRSIQLFPSTEVEARDRWAPPSKVPSAGSCSPAGTSMPD